jgi:long-chain acyl-CoA synthetase
MTGEQLQPSAGRFGRRCFLEEHDAMKRKLRGIKRSDIQLDFDLYRVGVPIPGVVGDELSVIDIQPAGVTRTILFVHGYAGCAETWELQINHFAREYRVIAPDLRGHGQSDAPYTRYTMSELVADLYAITQALQLPPRFVLVGHSFGGAICVEYANAHPEQIEELVLIATAGEYPLPKAVSLAYHLPTAVLRPVWDYRPRWNAEVHVMKRMAVNNMLQWQGWALMRAIRMPTLVITGERDTYFPRYVFEDVGKMIPGAQVVDVGASKHKVQLERHQAVNRAIERFVEQDERRTSWRGQDDATSAASRPWFKFYSKGTPRSVPIPPRPLHEFLESAAEWLPKRTATIFSGQRLTYRRLNERANQFAHVLHGLGIQPGDRVMLLLPNMPELIIAYYGTLKVGAVVVLPSLDADAALVTDQARQTGAEVLVTLHALEPLARVVRKATTIRDVIVADLPASSITHVHREMLQRLEVTGGDTTQEREEGAGVGRPMSELLRDAPIQPVRSTVCCDDLAAIVFTSGASDTPKGVRLSHANLVANTLQTRHWLPDLQYGQEVFLSVLPLMHSYGMTVAMNLPIALGATMLLAPSFELDQVLQQIWAEKPGFFPGVPSMFAALTRAANVRSYGLPTIHACISGAAPLPVEVQESFEKLTQAKLIEGYGLTEASPVTHADPMGEHRAGSVGVPLPNTDARIVDLATGADVPQGHVGELVVKGPQVMLGYWGQDSSSALQDGWLHTGDLASMDVDGFFQIIGRRSEIIVVDGQPIYPRDVEEVLYENNKVQEVAVIGLPGADGRVGIKAFVVPRPGVELTQTELVELCRRRLDAAAVPSVIELRAELPKSAVGKIIRRALLES